MNNKRKEKIFILFDIQSSINFLHIKNVTNLPVENKNKYRFRLYNLNLKKNCFFWSEIMNFIAFLWLQIKENNNIN